ncbi:hypothetical protein [Methanococcoides methylutens]|uniref:Uncharacterized protein n=1 Tax=Methanococcoides methylutens MM1 TaxID=1434104 RepID=A0A0E3X075_METMT|nr:hypothetical protein [Methanococcoides methylutens]AKB84095.1 hypothetical protein MCMEM_0042 [Methanococcoides methylutens MM1]
MKEKLAELLTNIFTTSGHNVTESDTVDLIVEKNDHKTLILLANKPDPAQIRNFADQVHGDTGLYVTMEKMETELHDYATHVGLITWDRDELALQIGKAVIADLEGNAADLHLVAYDIDRNAVPAEDTTTIASGSGSFEVTADTNTTVFESAEPSVQTAPQETVQEDQGFNIWGTSPEMQQAAATGSYQQEERTFMEPPVTAVPEPQPASWQTPQPLSSTLDLRTAPIKLQKERAAAMAKSEIGMPEDVVLKLVPFWNYAYAVKAEHRFKNKVIDISGQGQGCLNALNGNKEQLEIHQVTDSLTLPDDNYEIKSKMIDQKEAESTLISNIIEEYTKDVRFNNVVGEAMISEHKLFKPSMDDIRFKIELVYVPIWEVKGSRNSVEINAYTQEILTNPVDDDVEFM